MNNKNISHTSAKFCKIKSFALFTFHEIIKSLSDLHNCLYNHLIPNPNLADSCFLIPVKIETEQIPLIFVIILQIIRELFFTSLIVLRTVPYLQFNDKLLAEIGPRSRPCAAHPWSAPQYSNCLCH